MKTPVASRPGTTRIEKGAVYCPICTHTVEVEIVTTGRSARVRDGQKCSRCGSSIGSAYVLYRLDRAA
ncbi:MAG: hypothetical protein ABSF98_15675 [Bryobacteraceae bacterium]